MTTNFLIAMAELLRECPMCHKVTLNEQSKLDLGSDKIVRTCQCGYRIELDIKEGTQVPEQNVEQHKSEKPETRKEENPNGSNNS